MKKPRIHYAFRRAPGGTWAFEECRALTHYREYCQGNQVIFR